MRTRIGNILLAFLAALLFALPTQLWAWGNTGHEAVAYIAWQQMTPAARARAVQLLKLVPTLQTPTGKTVPGYSDWVNDLPAGLSPDDQNLYLFMRAATWPDSIKHVGFTDSDVAPAGVTTDVNIGFTDTKSHGYWHFVDAAFASDDSSVPPTPVLNAASQIAALRTAIASGETDALESYDMIWLEHLAGDVHQPLHGTVRYFAGKGDEGGNTVKIKLPVPMEHQFEGTLSKSAPTELHAFWDDLPGEGEPGPALPNAAAFAQPLPPASSDKVADTDPNDWASESLTLAQSDAYKNPPIGKSPAPSASTSTRSRSSRGSSSSSYLITQAYYDQAMKDAQARVALAGARLAKVMNDNLK
jgi:hypothetical protein